MSSRVFISRLLVVAVLIGQVTDASARSHVMSNEEVERRYDKLIEEEKSRTNNNSFVERLASGLAALAIGLYGHYNDNRGLLTRVVYSATQTAGVVMVSDAIHDAYQPSSLLLTDRYLNRRGKIDLDKYKRGIVLIERKRQIGEYKRLAYSSAILATLYAYDGYRERESDIGLKNAFYFLSFNFTLISAANFYRLFTQDETVEIAAKQWDSHVALLPFPSFTLYF